MTQGLMRGTDPDRMKGALYVLYSHSPSAYANHFSAVSPLLMNSYPGLTLRYGMLYLRGVQSICLWEFKIPSFKGPL